MSPLELQSGHHEAKEITPLATWVVTRVTIVAAGLLSLAPFVIGYALQ